MIARIITFQGAQYGLLAAPPNWDSEVKVTLELPTDVSKELITFYESRRNFAQSARYKMSWTAYLSDAASSTELRLFLTRIRGEAIFVPLWPDVCEIIPALVAGSTLFQLVDLPVRFGINWIIAKQDFSTWEIVTVSSVNQDARRVHLAVGVTHAYPAGTQIYPLLLGRLDDDRPKPEAITDESLEVELTIRENSQFSARVSPAAMPLPVIGPHIPAFSTTKKWDVAPSHVRPLDWTEMPDIVYEHVGFLRQEQQRVYDHRTPRGQELEFYQSDRQSAAKIEYFWRDRRANVLRFMIPTYRGDLRMSEDTPLAGHPAWIKCEKSFFSDPGRAPEPGDAFIALISGDDAVDPYLLGSVIDEAQSSRLVATHNVAVHKTDDTIVSHLLLARFAEATLEWTYTTPYLVTTRLKFIELPHEYGPNPPAALPEPAYLFIFVEAGIRTDRYTSYENTITIPGGTYQGTYVPAPFSFDTVKVGLKLDEEKLEFKSFKFLGNPLNKMWPFALDAILTVEIVEVNAAAPTSATAVTRFYGDVWSVDSSYKATAVAFGNLFERKFPRFLLSVSDNYTQFSQPTGLTPSGFLIVATIHNPGPPFNMRTSQILTVSSAAAHAKEADYFAGGWLEVGVGALQEKRGILHSEPATGSNVTLHIDRPLLKASNGAQINIYPGYDGSIDQCEIRFNNRINFGGHPFIPNVNPGVKAMKPQATQGGKKA
jgi:hypothetical protein